MSENHCSEEWRPVVGYEGWYSVSNLGRVRRDGGKILKVGNRGGYTYFVASKEAKTKHLTVHIAVASAFIGERRAGMQINHKNGIKNDNRPSNLEWVTPKENIAHSIAVLGNSRRGEKSGHAKLTAGAVVDIRNWSQLGESVKNIAEKLGVHTNTIYCVLNSRTWKHVECSGI